ncbi:hypothetical protein LSH36_958g00056, partial [Paralvinella palmiformis]
TFWSFAVELNACTRKFPCLNSGSCYDLPHGHYCNCPDSVIGNNFEISIEEMPTRGNKDVTTIVVIVVVVSVVTTAAVIIRVLYSLKESQKVPSVTRKVNLEMQVLEEEKTQPIHYLHLFVHV